MADYYPLIARAVAGLEKNNGDARRALYERARTALVAQLRGVTPSLSESDVTRERLALEEAIRKVEAESARQARAEPPRPEPVRKMRPPDMPRWEAMPTPSAAAGKADSAGKSDFPATGTRKAGSAPLRPEGGMARRQPPPQPAPRSAGAAATAAAPSAMFGESRYVDPVFDQPMAELAQEIPQAPPPPSPTRHALRGRPAGERRSLLDSGLKDFRTGVPDDNDLDDVPVRPSRPAREAFAHDLPPARPLDHERDRFQQELRPDELPEPAPRAVEPAFGADDGQPIPQRLRAGPMPAVEDEQLAPPLPRRSFGDLMRVASVAGVVLLAVGLAVWQWPTVLAFYYDLRAPSNTAEIPRETASAPSSSNKISDRFGAPQSDPQVTPAALPSAAAVAQRVVLYEEDPTDPNGKRFVGSAIWRTERVSTGPGQPEDIAIRADVEIPERRLAMTWSLRRNSDPGLPASHTVEIVFKIPEDFPAGGVSNVPGILMKQAEQTRGVPLAGLAVKVTNGFFLIGLSAVDADRDRNVALLKDRAWFDIPVVYANNRRAILALEKGTPGERAFSDAFAAWRQ